MGWFIDYTLSRDSKDTKARFKMLWPMRNKNSLAKKYIAELLKELRDEAARKNMKEQNLTTALQLNMINWFQYFEEMRKV